MKMIRRRRKDRAGGQSTVPATQRSELDRSQSHREIAGALTEAMDALDGHLEQVGRGHFRDVDALRRFTARTVALTETITALTQDLTQTSYSVSAAES